MQVTAVGLEQSIGTRFRHQHILVRVCAIESATIQSVSQARARKPRARQTLVVYVGHQWHVLLSASCTGAKESLLVVLILSPVPCGIRARVSTPNTRGRWCSCILFHLIPPLVPYPISPAPLTWLSSVPPPFPPFTVITRKCPSHPSQHKKKQQEAGRTVAP